METARLTSCRRGAASLLAVAALALVPSSGLAADVDAVARWLEQHPTAGADRTDPAVLALRRADLELGSELVSLAGQTARGAALRRRALELAAAVADEPGAVDGLQALAPDPDVGSLAVESAARVSARRSALGALGTSPGGEDPEGPLASAAGAREVAALARDPLLDAPRRRRAVLALPLGATATKLDVLALESVIAARLPGEGSVRAAAISVLGAATRARSPEGQAEADRARLLLARTLGALSNDDDPSVERALLDSMPLLRDEATLKAFVTLAIPEGASVSARARGLEALGRSGVPAARDGIERLLHDSVPLTEDEVRAAAIGALARLGARTPIDAVAALVDLLSSPRIEARSRALDSLRTLPRALVETAVAAKLVDPSLDDDVHLRAAEATRALELGLAGPLAQLARNERSSLAARTAAVRALALVGDSASTADALARIQTQAKGSPGTASPATASLRRAIAEALGSPALRGEIARRALENALADPSGTVRIAAARALGAQGDPRAAAILVQSIDRSDLRPRERAAVFRALATLGAWDEPTTARVAAALGEDASPEAGLAATEYFAGAPLRLAIPQLLDLLEHGDQSVRKVAHATLLAVVGARASVERGIDPFGYEAADGLSSERNAAIRSWRDWWERHQKDFE